MPARLITNLIQTHPPADIIEPLAGIGDVLAETGEMKTVRSLAVQLFVLKNSKTPSGEQNARRRLQEIVGGLQTAQWDKILDNRHFVASIWEHASAFLSRQGVKNPFLPTELPLTVTEHPLGGIVRPDPSNPAQVRILLAIRYGAEKTAVAGLTNNGARLEIHLKGSDDSLQNSLQPLFPVPVSVEQGLKRVSIQVALEEVLSLLDRLNQLGPQLMNKGTASNLMRTLLAAQAHVRGMELAWKNIESVASRMEPDIAEKENKRLKRIEALYREVKTKEERLEVLWRLFPALTEHLPEFNRLAIEIFSLNAAFETLVLQFYEPLPLRPRHPELRSLLNALKFYVSPKGYGKPSLLSRRIHDMVNDCAVIQDSIEKDPMFGVEREFWPGSIRQPFDVLTQFLEDAQKNADAVRDLLAQIKKKMALPSPQTREMQALLKQSLFLISEVLGPLPGEAGDFLAAGRGTRLRRRFNKRERWENHLNRIRGKIIEERQKPFEIPPEQLQEFEAIYFSLPDLIVRIAAKERIAKGLSSDSKNIHLQSVIDNVMAYRVTLGRFRRAYKIFYQHRKRNGDPVELLKPFYLDVRRYKHKMNTHLNRVEKAVAFLQRQHRAGAGPVPAKQKRYPVPDRGLDIPGHTVVVKEGWGRIDGVKVEIKGPVKTQNEKLKQVALLLDIPEAELAKSVALAHPMFKERVRKKILRGEPLRRLVKINEGAGIAVIHDERFGTVFYIPYNSGWVMRQAKAMVPMIPGAGGARSTGATMQAPMVRLRSLKYNAVTFDTPNHGLAVRDAYFNDLKKFMEWIDVVLGYFRFLANEGPRILPLVPIGRSHGENTLLQYAVDHPGKLDGLIGVSGYDPAWDDRTFPHLLERIKEGDFVPHPAGLVMAAAHDGVKLAVEGAFLNEEGTITAPSRDAMSIKVDGDKKPPQWAFLDPLTCGAWVLTPSLHFSATQDTDYQGVDRFWEERTAWVEGLPGDHRIVVIPGGRHDLLSLGGMQVFPHEKKRIQIVYSRIDAFITSVIANFTARQGGVDL